jgi:hypothetical protein
MPLKSLTNNEPKSAPPMRNHEHTHAIIYKRDDSVRVSDVCYHILMLLLLITSFDLHKTSFDLHITNFDLHRTIFYFHITSFDFHINSFDLHITSSDLHITNFDFHITSSDFHITSFDFHITSFDFHIQVSLNESFLRLKNILNIINNHFIFILQFHRSSPWQIMNQSRHHRCGTMNTHMPLFTNVMILKWLLIIFNIFFNLRKDSFKV